MNTITLKFPPDAKIATIAEKWYRDDENCIVATYTKGELNLAMAVMEASEKVRLSRQKKEDVVGQAMERFGMKASPAAI